MDHRKSFSGALTAMPTLVVGTLEKSNKAGMDVENQHHLLVIKLLLRVGPESVLSGRDPASLPEIRYNVLKAELINIWVKEYPGFEYRVRLRYFNDWIGIRFNCQQHYTS